MPQKLSNNCGCRNRVIYFVNTATVLTSHTFLNSTGLIFFKLFHLCFIMNNNNGNHVRNCIALLPIVFYHYHLINRRGCFRFRNTFCGNTFLI